MPPVITFAEALEKTKGKDRALLVGNGFSANYFTYPTLLAASGLEGTPLGNMFIKLGTADFEAVVRTLESAVLVEQAYGNNDHAKQLAVDSQHVREALLNALNQTHPAHREDVNFNSCAAFLANFGTIFSLNYDLLLYWARLEREELRDGFGLGSTKGRFFGPFKEDAHCHVFNLHGGLHLFDDGTGEMLKAVHTGDGVIATITDAITKKRSLPVYVAEGDSQQKMWKINSNAYLRHCYDKLRNCTASMFVYGHRADLNDEHIYHAIFDSEAQHFFFGIYKPDEKMMKVLDGRLADYQKRYGSKVEYSFFDSESASVWDA